MGCNTSKEAQTAVAATKDRHRKQLAPSSDALRLAIAAAASGPHRREREPPTDIEAPATAAGHPQSFPSSTNNDTASLISFSFAPNPMLPPALGSAPGSSSGEPNVLSRDASSEDSPEAVGSPTLPPDAELSDGLLDIVSREQPLGGLNLPPIPDQACHLRLPMGTIDDVPEAELPNSQEKPQHMAALRSELPPSQRGSSLRLSNQRRRHSSRSGSVDSNVDSRSTTNSLGTTPAGNTDLFLSGSYSPRTTVLLRKSSSSRSHSRSSSSHRISGDVSVTTDSSSASMRGGTTAKSVSGNTASTVSISYGIDPEMMLTPQQVLELCMDEENEDLICPTPPDQLNTPMMASPLY